MRIPLQVSNGSVVALGHFNPLIFRPDWFRDREIVVGSDFESIQIDIVHPDIVSFRLSWGAMQVDRDRFAITITQEPLIRMHDFFVKCFQLLPETPISGVGINRDAHFAVADDETLNRLGDRLAPKSVWGDFMEKDGHRFGGLRTLVMEQSIAKEGRRARADGAFGWVRVQVEPSLRVKHGVFVQVNDHYDLLDGEKLSNGRLAAELVAGNFAGAFARSELLIDRIMELTADA